MQVKWSEEAMSESFFISNMAPQVGAGFNRGIWSAPERKMQRWACERGLLYVVTGPLYELRPIEKLVSDKLEMWELLMFRAPLKVLIPYNYLDDYRANNPRAMQWLEATLNHLGQTREAVNDQWPEANTQYLSSSVIEQMSERCRNGGIGLSRNSGVDLCCELCLHLFNAGQRRAGACADGSESAYSMLTAKVGMV